MGQMYIILGDVVLCVYMYLPDLLLWLSVVSGIICGFSTATTGWLGKHLFLLASPASPVPTISVRTQRGTPDVRLIRRDELCSIPYRLYCTWILKVPYNQISLNID